MDVVTTRGNTAYCAGAKNQTLVSSFLDSWIGFSEQWESSELRVGAPTVTNSPADAKKRAAVVAAFKVRTLLLNSGPTIFQHMSQHAWSAYGEKFFEDIHIAAEFLKERDAMGDDEYHPISRTGSNLTKAGGIGYTVIDSIDSMLLMGLWNEHARALHWVTNKMSLDRDDIFNTFEVIPFFRDHDSPMIQTSQ